MKFDELKIKNEVIKAVTDNGYTSLTPIQEGIIDKVLEGSDVLAQAPTGTGKTAAFAIPMINKIDVNGGIQCIILCPTRELVNQIFAEVKKIGKYIPGFNAVEILGGVPVQSQVRLLKMLPQVVISSPGRMLDHIKNKNINLNNITTIILDEVDEMFNMGMRKDVTNIISSIPTKHQTILISATLSSDVTDASRKFQHEPFVYKVSTDDKQTTSTIKQYFVRVNRNQKVSLIKKLIDENGYKLVVVFSNMKHTAKRLADSLKAVGLRAEAIHSNLKQNARKRVMDEFRSGKHQVLIATDIIARGIDVKNIDAVINFETPQSAESYVHRIGRTGRAGEAGTSYLFLDDNND
jgi:ATP-dependent RNA helicase DeaD